MNKTKFFYFILILSSNLFFLPAHSDQIFEMGKDVFLNKAMCGSCHALSDAETVGQIGPNLNQIKPDIIRVISAVTNGIGVMPPYEGTLSMQEIEAVAHYVSISAAE
jgi:mono/diheme cytochrome c family protein